MASSIDKAIIKLRECLEKSADIFTKKHDTIQEKYHYHSSSLDERIEKTLNAAKENGLIKNYEVIKLETNEGLVTVNGELEYAKINFVTDSEMREFKICFSRWREN